MVILVKMVETDVVIGSFIKLRRDTASMEFIITISVIFIVWNIIVFILYGADKNKAKHGSYRISEKTLILAAAIMGGIGAMLGMRIFRHKTKHKKFVMGVPLLLILNIITMVAFLYFYCCLPL